MTRKSTSSSVNSRGASVCAVITPIASPVASDDRHGEERLEPLLLELGDVLHPRVVERVVADERRLAVLGRPPREALARSSATLPAWRSYGGDAARRTSRVVVLDEVDEARVDAARVGHEPHDGAAAPRRARATRRPSRRSPGGTSRSFAGTSQRDRMTIEAEESRRACQRD